MLFGVRNFYGRLQLTGQKKSNKDKQREKQLYERNIWF